MFKFLSFLFLTVLVSCAVAENNVEVNYKSSAAQKNAVVRVTAKLPNDASVVKVTVNGGETIGQVTEPGLNTEAEPGEKEIIFIAPELKAGDNAVVIGDKADVGDKTFSWKDNEGKTKDLFFDGKKVFMYQYEKIDETDKATREKTYKPYHMVYDWDGKNFITKGHGGKFTHHRGIYYGFSKCSYPGLEGKNMRADTWHCRGKAFQSHEGFVREEAGPVFARTRVKIDWHGQEGEVFANEVRELTIYFVDGVKIVDFSSSLSSELEFVNIDGDPQHAGFQYRASNYVASKTAKKTYYIRPGDGKDAPGKTKNWGGDKDMKDLLWKAQCTVIEDKPYTVCYLDSPGNPKPSYYSERDYGRFGSYFKTKVTKDKPLNIRYRLHIQQGEIEPADVEQRSKAFIDSLK